MENGPIILMRPVIIDGLVELPVFISPFFFFFSEGEKERERERKKVENLLCSILNGKYSKTFSIWHFFNK